MINRLNEMILKRGEKFIKELLNEHVVISEKLDTFRIQFEKNDGIIEFFSKDNKKIDIIAKTLNDVWDDAFLELPILIETAEVPEGYRFGLSYAPVERPLRIPYANMPKYILTDVSKRDKNHKIVESLSNEDVETWAGKLCVGKPPVIYEGRLTSDQLDSLMKYSTESNEDHVNFSSLITETFGSTYSKEQIIEGIIIQTNRAITQIVSKEFDMINESYEKNVTTRDFYDLVLLSLNSFMNDYVFPVLENEDHDSNYIDIVSDIFNRYCDVNNISESLDPKYLTPTNFGETKPNLNRKFIKNDVTKSLLNKSAMHESLFKIMLSSFRKYKKPYGLLDESFVEKFNGYVYMIDNYASKFNRENQTALNEALTNNVSVNAIRERQPSDIDNMRVIASMQKAFRPRDLDPEKGKTSCVVYVTSYKPFTISQVENVKNMKKQWNCNVILAAVSTQYRTEGDKFNPSDELVLAQMKSMQDFNRDMIDGYIMLDSCSLQEVFEYCRPRFEPSAIITDVNNKSEFGLQLFFEEEVMSKRIGVDDSFNVGEMENADRLLALRSIEDENFSTFNECVPAPIRNFYNNFINEYKLWNGAILKQ